MEHIKHFPSPFDMSAWIKETDTTDGCKSHFGAARPSSHRSDYFFYGTASFNEADRLLTGGDLVNAKKITDLSLQLDRSAQRTQRRAITPAVAGFIPNVPAAIQGLPVAMYSRTAQPAKPIKRLTVNVNCNASVNKTSIERAGALILSAINGLERDGYSVAVDMLVFAKKKNDTVRLSVTIKEAGQRFNAAQLAYCLANPSFLRRHFLAVAERLVNNANYFNGYGRPVDDEHALNLSMLADGFNRDRLLAALNAALH